MDAIKKKMQAMKLEKDNALDRALLCEQQARDANLRAEKAEEEARQLQKKIQAIENDLDQTQETLMQVNTKLEEKEKALQNIDVRNRIMRTSTVIVGASRRVATYAIAISNETRYAIDARRDQRIPTHVKSPIRCKYLNELVSEPTTSKRTGSSEEEGLWNVKMPASEKKLRQEDKELVTTMTTIRVWGEGRRKKAHLGFIHKIVVPRIAYARASRISRHRRKFFPTVGSGQATVGLQSRFTTMVGIISYGNRKRKPDCCSRPKQSRGSGNGGKRKQHSKKDRQARWRRDEGGHRRRGGENQRRLPKHAEVRMRFHAGGRVGDALSNSKKRSNNGFQSSIFELVDKTFDTKLWDHAGVSADTKLTANKQDVVNGAAGGGGSVVVGASIMCENNSGPGPGTGGRKRGHQHHPRFGGTRQSTVPAEDVIAALRGAFDCSTNSLSSSSLSSSASSLNVSITGSGGVGGGGSDRIVTGSDGTCNNNNNPLVTERTTISKQSDDNDAELLDDYEIATASEAATADIVNSNIKNNNITSLGVRWSGEPSKENTPEPEQDLLNNNRSNSSSNRSSVSPKNVIPLDEVADTDGRPHPVEPISRTTEPDEEDSIELKLDQITSGKELVQQINKKLKRSKRSPQTDDTGAPVSGKKKSSSSSKKSSSKTGSTGTDGGKRKKSKSSAAAAAAAALEQRASGDGASCDLDAVIGGLLGAGEYGGGLAGGNSKEQLNDENDPDVAEWAKLRCTSERTEVIAEREHRRQKRCADYPGLAFGRSIFSSDTMMKFNIIRNELHNIMKTQLKRTWSQNATSYKHWCDPRACCSISPTFSGEAELFHPPTHDHGYGVMAVRFGKGKK
uniref:Tropomyosin n=1 Tax=Anopheles culicifacies TaxID=139723 RepID=A0A182M0Z9_9DIPT